MKKILPLPLLVALTLLTTVSANAQTSWNSTSDGTWSTAGNWTAGSPATGPQLAIYPGTTTLQRTLNLAGATGQVSIGAQFDNSAGNVGYTFTGTAGSVVGLFLRAGGTANGIVNNDHNAQTFNVPVKLTSGTGIAGAGAAMTFSAASGDLIFNGNNNAPAAPWTINLNGASALTIAGSHNVTIGSSGPGQIVNTNVGTTSGILMNGTGTLTLGGTAANTFAGVNTLNAGTVVAGKANALGSGNGLVLGGGTFEPGAFSHTLGTLTLAANSTIDLSLGTASLTFANSSAAVWGGFSLNILGWSGSDTLNFGASGLTATQLGEIVFSDQPGSPTAQMDPNGNVTPMVVPEPSSISLGLLGGFVLWASLRRRR